MDHDRHRVIVHIDIDCFYAQVEMIRNPTLRDKPLGIQQKNIIVTCNYEARRRGATKLMFLTEAKKKCPDLVIVNGEDLTHYRQMSYQISDYIQRYSPCVERLGFDENFVDVTEMARSRLKNGEFKKQFVGHVYGDKEMAQDSLLNPPCTCGCELQLQIGSQIAADIREGLEHDLSITCCAGVAHNKLLAKLVGSINKPNQQTSILPHLACQMMSSLPGVRAIPGIGSKTAKRLNSLGVQSVSDLRQTQLSVLEHEFGQGTAPVLLKLAVGVDESPVVTFGLPQTLSDEDSFKCCNQISDARSRTEQLLNSLLERLREDGRIPQTLRLTLRRTNYHRESRQCSVPQGIFTKFYKSGQAEITQQQLLPILMNLFSKMVKDGDSFHLTLINVCFAKLVKPVQNKLSSFFTHSKQQSQTCFMEIDESNMLDTNNSKLHLLDSIDGAKEKGKGQSSQKITTQSSNASSALITQSTSSHCIDSLPPPSTPERLGNNVTTLSKGNNVCDGQSNMIESLRSLLPPHLDAQTVLELPDAVQQEILSQYGIYSQCSPSAGKRFVSSEAGVSTRSQCTSSRKPLFSPKKKNQKRTSQSAQEDENEINHKKQPRFDGSFADLSPQQLNPEETENGCVTSHKDYNSNVINEKSDKVNIGSHCENQFIVCHEPGQSTQTRSHRHGTSDHILHSGRGFSELTDTSKMCSSDGSIPKTDNVLTSDGSIDSHTNKKTEDFVSNESMSLDILTHNRFMPSSASRQENKPYTKSFVPSTSGSGTSIAPNKDVDIDNVPVPHSSPSHSNSRPIKTVQSQCPQGIDPDVFSALPSNIRGEILAHAAMGSGHIFLNTTTTATNSTNSVCENKKKEQKTLLAFFQKT